MTDKTVQEQIDEAVEAAVSALRAKNTELLNEKKTAKAQADAAKTAAEEAATRADEAEEARARATNDTAAIEKTLAAKYEKQIAALTTAKTSAEGTLQKLLVDNGITAALASANVAPALAKAAAALLRAESNIEITDGAATVNGVPLADHIGQWVQTEGAHFVAAPVSAGGGSQGSSAAATNANAWTADNFNSRIGEFSTLAKTDKPAAIRAAQAAGRHDMVATLSE